MNRIRHVMSHLICVPRVSNKCFKNFLPVQTLASGLSFQRFDSQFIKNVDNILFNFSKILFSDSLIFLFSIPLTVMFFGIKPQEFVAVYFMMNRAFTNSSFMNRGVMNRSFMNRGVMLFRIGLPFVAAQFFEKLKTWISIPLFNFMV